MAYSLGLVKPHVRRAAEYFGPRHGIKTVYGFGPGSVPGSDHPKGLALDFMTSNKTVGDSLVADLMTNAKSFGIKYIIWWRRIWSPGKGWSDYHGPSPHTNHVHVSFDVTAGSGEPVGTVPVANPLVPDSVEQLVQVFRNLEGVVKWLTDSNNWQRIGLFAIGWILIMIAVFKLDNVVSAGKKVIKSAK